MELEQSKIVTCRDLDELGFICTVNKRDFFAAMFASSAMAREDVDSFDINECAALAVECADALIKQLKKEK